MIGINILSMMMMMSDSAIHGEPTIQLKLLLLTILSCGYSISISAQTRIATETIGPSSDSTLQKYLPVSCKVKAGM